MEEYALLLIALVLLICLRWLMSISVMLALSKKAWVNYKSTIKGFDRWFLWSVPSIVREKYSKYEKRRINYPVVVSMYRSINLFMHCCFLILAMVYVIDLFIIDFSMVQPVFMAYLVAAGICFLLYCASSLYVNWRFHKSRYGLK